MDKVLVLLGKTGSGKTTLANALSKHGYERIVTYTTRPMREGEVNHVDYHFVNEEKFMNMIKDGFLAEYTSYNAQFGHVYYGSAKGDYILSNDNKKKVIVLNPYGLDMIIQNAIPHISVYIDVNPEELVKRTLTRGDNPYEVTRRLKADERDFKDIQNKVGYIINGEESTLDIVNSILEKTTMEDN